MGLLRGYLVIAVCCCWSRPSRSAERRRRRAHTHQAVGSGRSHWPPAWDASYVVAIPPPLRVAGGGVAQLRGGPFSPGRVPSGRLIDSRLWPKHTQTPLGASSAGQRPYEPGEQWSACVRWRADMHRLGLRGGREGRRTEARLPLMNRGSSKGGDMRNQIFRDAETAAAAWLHLLAHEPPGFSVIHRIGQRDAVTDAVDGTSSPDDAGHGLVGRVPGFFRPLRPAGVPHS